VRDLTPLSGLPRLADLWLSATAVRDLTALARLPGLQRLYLDETAVADLTPLAGLPELLFLDLREAPVASEQVAEIERRRPGLTVALAPPTRPRK